MIPKDFKGRARRLDDLDLPRAGKMIGVGEDEIHAVLEVESRGSGFDKQGRPLILFEPHVFFRELNLHPVKRQKAVNAGLAYRNWGERAYPPDSYPRLIEAMAIDETAALKSASWGLGQIMGGNYKAAGYASVQEFVAAMCDDEEHHLNAMIAFIVTNKLDDEIRRHDWAGFARGYNGPGYAKNAYDTRLARAYAKWSKIKDTPFTLTEAAKETMNHDAAPAVVIVPPAATPARPAPPRPAEMAATPGPVAPAPSSAWSRIKAWLGGGA